MVVAIVTGASRGIGAEIAYTLSRDGMDVVVNDINPQLKDLEQVRDKIKKEGGRAIAVIGDVSKEEDVKSLVQSAVKEFGELNVMVANAGVIAPKTIVEISPDEFDRVLAINTRGAFLCYREAALQMISQGKGGKIIGACSLAGFRPSANTLAYSVSKWAVRGLTQASALDLAPYNINVNAYCPGPVATPMWEVLDADAGRRAGLQKGEAFKKSVETRSALKRPSEPSDIANLVSFLVSEKSRNMTGQSLLCDGGIFFS